MNDPRIAQLADVLIDHSCELQPGENVLIEAFDLPEPNLICTLIEKAAARGAHPFVSWKNNEVLRALYTHGTDKNIAQSGAFERARMEQMQAYIGVRGAANSSQFSDVPGAKMEAYQKQWWNPVHTQVRVPKTKWVVLRYPTHSMAQSARMSTAAFEDFYYAVCTVDYAQMGRDQEPLVELMNQTDRVRITGPGTELTFSIKDLPARPCHGQRNIPDGEVFTAPVRESINGTIRYNAASLYQGTVFDGIQFQFKDGKIIEATCSGGDAQKLNEILDADEGARYIGEWSLGCNNLVKRPMLDILFDEKIGGSIHLTPGQAYDEADNGNRSCVHWDLVLIQTPEYGGGEIYFDDKLVRKDGKFVIDSLQGLNG